MEKEDNKKLDIFSDSQLDLTEDQLTPDYDPLNIYTGAVWNQVRKRDEPSSLILILLKDGAQYYKNISVAECEDQAGLFYF